MHKIKTFYFLNQNYRNVFVVFIILRLYDAVREDTKYD